MFNKQKHKSITSNFKILRHVVSDHMQDKVKSIDRLQFTFHAQYNINIQENKIVYQN